MARSTDALQRDNITQQAQQTGAAYAAPSSNAALDLARGLAQIQPEAEAFMQGYAEDQQKKATLQARKDAITANGAKLADAVRDGKITPTQNPWYMQAYAREGAAVRSQSALAKLQQDSASWSTRNDPQAFAKQWNESLGEIGKDYSGKDELAGFEPVANQFTQQALQANTAQNVQRIETERVSNLSALTAHALQVAVTSNGGTISGEQAAAAVEPARLQWMATGGSAQGWATLLDKATTAAAYGQKDQSLIDLKKAFGTDGALVVDGKTLFGSGGAEGDASPLPHEVAGGFDQRDDGSPLSFGKATPGVADLWPHLITAESGGRQSAVSPKGAFGVAQLMPGTAKSVAAQLGDPSLAEKAKSDPAVNAKLGQTYLQQQMERFPGRPDIALAAYNWGPHRPFLQRAFDKGIQGGAFLSGLPAETRDYVGKITAAAAATGAPPTGTPAVAQVPVPPIPTAPTPPLSNAPSIYDIAGVADSAESDRYRIKSSANGDAQDRLRQITAQRQLDGMKAANDLWASHGTSLMQGADPQVLSAELTSKGYSPQVVAEALSQVRQAVGDTAALGNARLALRGNNPVEAKRLLDLSVEGIQKGYTPEYEQKIGQEVLLGNIAGDDGLRMISNSVSRTRQLEAEQRQDEATTAAAGGHIYKMTQVGGKADAIASLAVTGYETAGKKLNIQGYVSPTVRRSVSQQVRDTMNTWLVNHPGDFAGAETQGRAKAAGILNSQIQRLMWLRANAGHAKRPTSSSKSANPRGN